MKNMNDLNVFDLNTKDMKNIDGGFKIMYPGQTLLELVLRSINGAYEAGYDSGQNNCGCQ